MKTWIVALALLAASDGEHNALAAEPDPREAVDLSGDKPPAGAAWLESIDLSRTATGFGLPTTGATVSGNPISIGGKAFMHGVGVFGLG